MLQILKKRYNFTLRWFLDLGNTSLEQNLKIKTLDYLLFISAIFYLLFGCSRANFQLLLRKQSHSLDVNHCIQAINFWPKGDFEGLGVLIAFLVGFHHNDITHLPTHPKLQKIPSPDLNLVFRKCGNASNTQNGYSLTLQWPLGFRNSSLDAGCCVQNFRFS